MAEDFRWLPAPGRRQRRIHFDGAAYSAFPHVERLDGDELLLAFRQAPRQRRVRHTHPRSVITVLRSPDLGRTWLTDDATQLAAGGGQEMGLIYLGDGKVGGALAVHAVVPVADGPRAGIVQNHAHEYPFACVGALWCTSPDWGLTWPWHEAVLVGPGMQACAPPVQLADGTLTIPAYGAIGRSRAASAVLYRSIDGGATWSSPAVITRGSPRARSYAEPALIELGHGRLLSLLRVGGDRRALPGTFYRSLSSDGGRTWSAPRPTTVRSGACPRLLRLRDTRLLLTYGRRFAPFGIYASLSDDDGRTWGPPLLLRPTPDGNQGYTSSLELSEARILTTSYARDGRGITGITGTFWQLP